MLSEALTDHLKSLHTAAIDARNGYTEALEDAGGKGMTPLFQEMIALHAQNADELASELGRLGEKADDSGSFMTTIHRTIISIRALFNGLGESVLPGLIDGEERNLKHYGDVLQAGDVPVALEQVLVAERNRILAAVVRMRAAQS